MPPSPQNKPTDPLKALIDHLEETRLNSIDLTISFNPFTYKFKFWVVEINYFYKSGKVKSYKTRHYTKNGAWEEMLNFTSIKSREDRPEVQYDNRSRIVLKYGE